LEKSFDSENQYWVLSEKSDNNTVTNILLVKQTELPDEFENAEEIVIGAKFDKTQNAHIYYSTKYINPWMTLPYIPDLEERAKILNFHVPMSWIAVLAYLISMIYAIMYLKKRDFEYDIKASASAYLGTIFTILATVTGMLWAKFNWGAYWNWDPRQTSIFILLLIYFAYFTLRASIENKELKARLSSVYSIIAFITVPFLIFVLPRMVSGLHPGSADDSTIGPVLDAGSEAMNLNKQFTFSLALFAFTMVFFWMMNILVRFKLLKERYDKFFN
jgi:heme exporter protein C